MNCEIRKPMSGSEIAKEMGMSRQAVSYSIKKSMKKMYKRIKNLGMADTPFQIILVLMTVLNVNSSVEEIKNFMKLFDEDITKAVMEDAKNTYNIRQ